MDSSGLRVVIDAHQQALAAGSRLVVHAPSTSVRKIVEISGLADHLFLD
jgi:anti-sigma B factor antagonist